MTAGGYRPGAGRPRGSKKIKNIPAKDADALLKIQNGDLSPLEYLLGVVNDPTADADRRDRLAMAAAPYCHGKPAPITGKKGERETAAKKAGAGKFAVPEGPRLLPKQETV